MNSSQYLEHGAVICHAGVKGMKWGKHLKAASNWIDENITGNSAQREADQYLIIADAHRQAGDRHAENSERYSNTASNIENHKPGLGAHNSSMPAKNHAEAEPIGIDPKELKRRKTGDHASALAAANRAKASDSNRKRFQEEQAMRQADAKRASAQRRADKSLFGRVRTIFGKPKLSMVVRK